MTAWASNRSPGWGVWVLLGVLWTAPARAQEDTLPEGPSAAPTTEVPATEDPPATMPDANAPNAVAPKYVVWRIKAGTGAGALAPRLERRLRKDMETQLGPLMLSKAAQTGIILIRPELADCDANMPCALDVAEALSVRFVVGGEAEASATPTVTGWVIDRERGAEVKRVTVPLEGTGEAAETTAVENLTRALMALERVEAVDAKAAQATQAKAAASESGGWRSPLLGGALLAGAGATAAAALAVALGGGGGVVGALALAWVRSNYHTRRSTQAMLAAGMAGGILLGIGVVLLVAAAPLAGLGVLATMGLP